MKKFNLKKLLVLAAAVLIIPMVGCGGTGDTKSDSFKVVQTTAPVGFSPIITNDAPSSTINCQLYETLFTRSMDGLSYVPLLAESYTNPDDTTWNFKLRQGVKFHDGEPFNAEAVKFTLETIKDPAAKSGRASIAASIDKMTVINEYELEIKTSYPDGVLIAKLAHTNAAIVSPKAYKEQKITNPDNPLMNNPVGTGAYKFVSMISGAEVKLTRFDEYWGVKPEIKDITFSVVSEVDTTLARLQTEEADYMDVLPADQVKRVQTFDNINILQKEGGAITYMAMATKSPKNPNLANNLNFRKAVVMAVDTNNYIKNYLNGLGVYSRSMIGPKIFGYTAEAENYGYKYNVEEAKKIVTENNLANEKITIVLGSTPAYLRVGQFVQDQLVQAGFKNVVLEPLEWATYLSKTKENNSYDISVFGWSNVTGDGTEMLDPNFHSVNSSKRVRFDNADLDALIDASKKTLDKEVRTAKIQEANKMILEQAVATPLYNGYLISALNKKFTNLEQDPGGLFYVKNIKRK